MSYFANIIGPPVTNGLVGWWRFRDGSGTTAVDSSGFGNNGTLVGPPTWVKGKIRGNALNFNGSSYVSLPFGLNFNPSSMSVAVWLNVTTFSSNPRLIANDHTDSDNKGFQLMINNGGASGFFDVGATGGTGSATWTHTISTGIWYHYVGVYTGSAVMAYINGILVATGTTSGTLLSGTSNLAIGYNPAYSGDFFTGIIGEVRLYKRALSQSEITLLYNAQ